MIQSRTFTGTITALITPFRDGEVDFDDLARLTVHQVEQGIDGIAAVGTTGESPTLDYNEHMDVVRCVMERAAKRIPVIAGTGSNSTKEAVELTKHAHDAGVDGILLVAPYYNKPTQEGLFRHFSAVADATDKPIVLYSIPSRCGIEIGVDTVTRLRAKYPHVTHIKEAGGSCDRVALLRQAMGDDLVILSGDDGLTLPFMSLGAQGVISVASNLVVADLVRMVRCALQNDFKSASEINERYYPLFRDLFIESNPAPVKAAMVRSGLISSEEVRSPLCTLEEENRKALYETMDRLGL